MELVRDDFPWLVQKAVPELHEQKEAALAAVLAEFAAWVPTPTLHNFRVASDHPFFGRLYDAFLRACADYFEPYTLHAESSRACWAYVQNRDRKSPIWHDHLATSTINGVYYLAVPDPSGQICFRHLDRVVEVTPLEGHLYAFPRWLAHRPQPQASLAYRVSLNVEIITREYPIVRATGLRW